MPSPVAISATGAILGLLLLIFAWRGRRIDDHPLCRKCRFDLVGLPAGVEKCSECGASLKRRRAITLGHRRVRRLWLLIAILLVCGSGGWQSQRAYQFARHNDLNPYKPVWWLLVEARGASAKRDPAFARLLQLLNEKKLNARQTHDVIALILAAQADPKRTWQQDWGRIVEDLHEEGVVSEDEWNTYWRQALSLRLDLRETVCKDDDLPVRLRFSFPPKDSGRFRPDPPLLVRAQIGALPLVVLPTEAYYPARMRMVPVNLSLYDVVAKLPDGPQTLRANVMITRSAPVNRSWFAKKQKEPEPIVVPLEGHFTLLPPRHPTVVLVRKPELQSQLLQSIRLEPITIKRRKGTLDQMASSTITITMPPIDIAFTASLRQGGYEWSLGRFACAAGQRQECHLEARADALEEPHAYLILRPDVSAAASTIQIKEIWGEDIVIEKVPVKGP